MFDHLFFMLCFSWNVIRVCLMEQQMWVTLEQFSGIPQDPVFMCRSNSLLWKSRNYQNAIQMNLKMFLCA